MFPVFFAAAFVGFTGLTPSVKAQAGYNITDDTFFYGQSPPVYPSPNGTGAGDWSDAYNKAWALVEQMSLEEKVNLTIGIPIGADTETGCEGRLLGIPRLGFPGMCFADAGDGLRNGELVSSFPAGIHVGASWNRELALKRGSALGAEFKKKGVNVVFGPVVGPAGRVVKGGRNWEGFSSDVWQAGQLVAPTVRGIQGAGVITSVKHFVANEQEVRRTTETGGLQAVSSNMDDKTLHEVYVWPFVDALHAGAANIMCSYNRLNNSYGCQNSRTLNGILKTELGFQGVVMSDWGAQHAGVANALAGMDSAALPEGGDYWTGLWGLNLTHAVQNGSVPESRLNDMIVRLLASWYQVGQDVNFPVPGSGFPLDVTLPHLSVDARDPDARPILLQSSIEGHVLVKNTNNALPLKSPKMLSIFGYSGKLPDTYVANTALAPGLLEYTPTYFNGTIFMGGGSGSSSPSTPISPFDAIVRRAYQDYTALNWDFLEPNPAINANSDACLVIGNAVATEGTDRTELRDDYTDSIILNVAANCSNTIVILHNQGVRLVDTFVDHPNVTAIIFAHAPGEESGNALVSILYGEANPSGRLPYTVAKNESDYGSLLDPTPGVAPYGIFPQSNFTEGAFFDYKAFDKADIEPRYEFGFGLSYTTFSYSGLTIKKAGNASFTKFPTGPILQGGPTDLWDVLATVSVTVTNTGAVDGADVPQLYLGIPTNDSPIRQLRGFSKPTIKAGESVIVRFPLSRRDLSIWDVVAQKWSLVTGSHNIEVGSSSRALPLVGKLTI